MTGPRTARLRAALRAPTVRTKMVVGLALLLGAIALFMLVVSPIPIRRMALRGIDDKGHTLADITARALGAPVLFDDSTGVASVIGAARQDPDLRWMIVEDGQRRVIAAYGLELARAQDYRSSATSGNTTGGYYRIIAPVVVDQKRLGQVYLGISLGAVEASIARSRRDIIVLILLIFLLGFAGAVIMSSILTRPLHHMATVVADISAGNLSRRVGRTSGDEVGVLADAFDSMVDRLVAAYGEVQAMNKGLEARVAARTEELQRAYDERLVAQKALEESEARFRTMFESSAMGIVLIGKAHDLIEANPAFAEMIGQPRAALIGRSLPDFIEFEEHQDPITECATLMAGGHARMQCELRFRTAGGGVVWGRSTVSAVRDGDGQVQFAIAMIENMTGEKELAEQLRQAQKLEAIGRLAGGVAHDFNNLLTTINGLADLMLAELNGAEHLRADLTEVRRSGERAAALTRQLLAFSRRQVLQPKVLDLNETIGEMAAMLRRLIGEDIQLVLTLDPRSPRTKADPVQITQVLLNLAVNARDAMPSGGRLSIETAPLEVDAALARRYDVVPGCFAMIRVNDTGHGMDAATAARVFEPFFTTKEVGRGTGLGLATVYGVVKQSGGGIHVDSAPDLGATFTILLPGADFVPAAPPTRPIAPDPTRGDETILLVEDEEPVRSLAARVLRREGYSVIECANAGEALHHAEHAGTAWDAIVTDVVMPGMSGPDLVARLATLQPDLKVLYLSGYPREELEQQIGDADVGFLQKPMSPAALTAAVRAILDETAGMGVG